MTAKEIRERIYEECDHTKNMTSGYVIMTLNGAQKSVCCDCMDAADRAVTANQKTLRKANQRSLQAQAQAVIPQYGLAAGMAVEQWQGGFLPGASLRTRGHIVFKAGVPYVQIEKHGQRRNVRWNETWKPAQTE